MPIIGQIEPVIKLGWLQVLLLLAPVAAVCAISGAMKLGQIRRVSIASARAVVQLLAVGLVIGWVFRQNTWPWVVGLLAVMTVIAGLTAAAQVDRYLSRTSLLMSVVLGAVTAVVLLYLTQVVIDVDGWPARYWIPLGGMLLGNAMTAATLAVERLTSEMATHRHDVEAMLCMGASPAQAIRPALRRAITAAMTPTLNAMMIVGVVKLPGMMTGQMLGGSEPMQAALYQLLILVGITMTDMLAAIATAHLLARRCFTPADQLNRNALR